MTGGRTTIGAIALTALLALAAALPWGVAAAAGDDDKARMLTVRGTGKVRTLPDRAEVTAGVVTQAATASAALADNGAAIEKLFAALAGFDIAARDIRTTSFAVAPVYELRERGRGPAPPRIVAYRVTNQVRATVRELARLGPLLDALVAAGANRMSGLRFMVGEQAPLADRARRRAMADARRKAALYAKEAGVTLGRVLRIAEGGVQLPRPLRLGMAEARAVAVPVAPGEQAITASVSVTWEIE